MSTKEVLAAIDSVTHREGDAYQKFVRRAGENQIGRRVKLADLSDNSDPGRIASPTKKDRARVAKYERAMAWLAEATGR